ncbi:MAG TPA: DEAD/DEAH box helicase [Candidatus Marinimicrobia bacterium]|jgi:ATP-dependent RNA helicase RhlE|nr:DEAD/DEAH box helicase [Candidatus Neomarinimicrobiota bacterium]HIL86037.1 DEAD/DEAH box helicase [Candidatus Neomarinimicrobiota bacterium]
MSFDTLGLYEPILKALKHKGYKEPSPIQAKAIPAILERRDVMAAAQTGTGKTASFILPILHMLSNPKHKFKGHVIRTLIVTPTRELAAQVRESAVTYGRYLDLKSTAIYGGTSVRNQKKVLRKGVDILVATPGRLLDLYNQKSIDFSKVEILVLDEADQMLDMGFINDIKKIIRLLPDRRQNLMFTATFSDPFRALANKFSYNPLEISVTRDNETAKNIEHYIHPVDTSRKSELLIHLIKKEKWKQALVFTRTKHGANRLTKKLIQAHITAVAIHGNKTQNYRTRALDDFKKNRVKILVATDVAARGIDIKNMNQVINFDLPTVAKDYVHRIGRTGRAGESGKAISFVGSEQFELLDGIQKLLQQTLAQHIVDGFEPSSPIAKSNSKVGKKQRRFNKQSRYKKKKPR